MVSELVGVLASYCSLDVYAPLSRFLARPGERITLPILTAVFSRIFEDTPQCRRRKNWHLPQVQRAWLRDIGVDHCLLEDSLKKKRTKQKELMSSLGVTQACCFVAHVLLCNNCPTRLFPCLLSKQMTAYFCNSFVYLATTIIYSFIVN